MIEFEIRDMCTNSTGTEKSEQDEYVMYSNIYPTLSEYTTDTNAIVGHGTHHVFGNMHHIQSHAGFHNHCEWIMKFSWPMSEICAVILR